MKKGNLAKKKGLLAGIVIGIVIFVIASLMVYSNKNTGWINMTGNAISSLDLNDNTLNVVISDKVVREKSPALGAVFWGGSYWDSYWRGKYIVNNLDLRNPGFEYGCQRYLISPGDIYRSTSNFTRVCANGSLLDVFDGLGYIFRKPDFWKGAKVYVFNLTNNALIVGATTNVTSSTIYNGTLVSGKWQNDINGSNCINIEKPITNFNSSYVELVQCGIKPPTTSLTLTSWPGYINMGYYNYSIDFDNTTFVDGSSSVKMNFIRRSPVSGASNSTSYFISFGLTGDIFQSNYSMTTQRVGSHGAKARAMTYNKNNNALFVVDVNGSVYSSLDNGANWSLKILNYGGPINVKDLFSDKSNLYIIADKEIWKSSDLGATWSKVNASFSQDKIYSGAAAYTEQYNLLFSINEIGKVFKSIDEGKNWVYISDCGGLTPVAMTFTNNTLFVVDVNGSVYSSVNNGTTWTKKISNFGRINDSLDLFSDEKGNLFIIAGKNGEAWGSTNLGISWNLINRYAPSSATGIGTTFTTQKVGPKRGVNYTLSFWMKGTDIEKDSIKLYFSDQMPTFYFNVTDQWQKFEFNFTGNNTDYLGFGLYPYGNAILWMDNLELKESNSGEIMQYQIDLLKEFKPGSLRFMSYDIIGYDFWDLMIDNNFEKGPSLSAGMLIMSVKKELVLSKQVGASPWINVPPGTTPDEMKFLVEYLNGPTSSPGGALRLQQGHANPWTEDFNSIYIELGNEMWNWGYLPFAFDEVNQARWFNSRYNAAKASPYYNDKIHLLEGGQHANTWRTWVHASNARNFTDYAIATYLSPQNSVLMGDMKTMYEDMFMRIYEDDAYRVPVHKNFLKQYNQSTDMVIYELNTDIHCFADHAFVFETRDPQKFRGTQISEGLLGNLNIFDEALMYAKNNFSSINLYQWDSDGTCAWALNRGYMYESRKPIFYAAELYNNYAAGGDLINYSLATNDKSNSYYNYTFNLSSMQIYSTPTLNGVFNLSMPYVKVYPYKEGNDYSVVLINTKIDGSINTTVRLPVGGNRNAVLYYMTADNPETRNTYRENVIPQYKTLSFNQNASIELKPYSMYLLRTYENQVDMQNAVNSLDKDGDGVINQADCNDNNVNVGQCTGCRVCSENIDINNADNNGNCVLATSETNLNSEGCPIPNATKFSPELTIDFRKATLVENRNFSIGKAGFGKISFIDGISLFRYNSLANKYSAIDLDKNINFSERKIFINSSFLPELNYPAELTFYNIYYVSPILLRDGSVVKLTNVTNRNLSINYVLLQSPNASNGYTLKVIVPGFSTYEIVGSVVGCGDNICNNGENCSNCAVDCGVCVDNPPPCTDCDGSPGGPGPGGPSVDNPLANESKNASNLGISGEKVAAAGEKENETGATEAGKTGTEADRLNSVIKGSLIILTIAIIIIISIIVVKIVRKRSLILQFGQNDKD